MSPPELIGFRDINNSPQSCTSTHSTEGGGCCCCCAGDFGAPQSEGIAMMAEALDGVATPMFAVTAAGEVTAWNRKMLHVSGLSGDDVCRSLLSEFVVESSSWERSLCNALRRTQVDDDDECCCFIQLRSWSSSKRSSRGGDAARDFRVRIVVNRDPSGEALGALCFASPHNKSLISENEAENQCEQTPDPAMLGQPPITHAPSAAQELRQLIDLATCPIFGVDNSGLINEWNTKMAMVTGTKIGEAMHKDLVDEFIAPSSRESFRDVYSSAESSGRGKSHLEVEILTQTDETRLLLVSATPRLDADGNINGVWYVAHDVTETSQHNRAVAAMADELRQLIDKANAPIFGIDCTGDVNEWNDMTAQITGFSKEEAFDRSLVDSFIAPYMRDAVQDILANSLERQTTSNFELDFETKLGDIRHLSVNATTRRDAENNVIGVVVVAQDVTEAVLRDRAVAGMALELRQLIDTANAPIFGIDVEGNVNEWNRRTQEITGYLKEDAFGEPLIESFIAPSMQHKVQEILDAALRGYETSNYELEFLSKSREPRFLLVNATTRRDPEGNIVGVVGVAQDVTEDRKHTAELRKMQYIQATQEAKVETERNMTAYFAHELRNPLSAIDGALSAMPDDLPDSARSLVTGMKLCSRFMSSTMNNLLDVRKMEEGNMKLTNAPMSLRALLSGVHGMLLPSIKPGVKFNAECHTAGRDWVIGDEHRMQQMLTNVITHAIKYTLAGSVTVTISWENDKVKFTCVDTGPGVPKKAQENLFQRVVQRGGAPGAGLGLAIAKHLVDLAAGTITFVSDPNIANGSTCMVYIPLPRCESPDASNRDDDSTRALDVPLRFLIIDDIKINRTMLKRRIHKNICPQSTIVEAPTGERALELCSKDNFDVIIIDQYMEEAGGVMFGTDVVYAMRRMRIDSIIIGCSGNDMDAEFGEAGVDWVWQKPLPPNGTIIAHLRTALAAKHKL